MKSIEQKRKEANARARLRESLSAQDQLARIERRPGESKRETERLINQAAAEAVDRARSQAEQRKEETAKLNRKKQAGHVIIPSRLCEAKKR